MRSIRPPDAGRLSANFNNGLSSSVLGHSNARRNFLLQVAIEGAAKYHFRSCHRRKISSVRLPTRLGREKPVRRKRDGKFFAAQARAQRANFLQHDERSRASAPDRRQLEPCWGSAKKLFPLYGLAGTRSSELP